MNPEHHEERLRTWAISTKRPVLSLDYGKAPECKGSAAAVRRRGTFDGVSLADPYPFARDEAFDTYRLMTESSMLPAG